MAQYLINLTSNGRKFAALSNYDENIVFRDEKKPWNRIILLLHGFPDDLHSFDEIWDILVDSFEADNAVLLIAPSMRGYQTSSQGSESDYKYLDLALDVDSWITVLNHDSLPLHIIGHDWGAIAAFKAASTWPEKITSMACLAIPYLANLSLWEILWYCPEQFYNSSYMLRMQFEIFYKKQLEDTSFNSYVDQLWRQWSPNWDYGKKIDSVKATLRGNGVIKAATAYYRCAFNPFNIRTRYWLVNFDSVPTLILGGENDGCMSQKLFHLEEEKLKAIKTARVEVIPTVGHFLHREEPTIVASKIVAWFKEH